MNIAILIATRNNPSKVDRLLDSLTFSSNHINQLIVVSSGENISATVDKFTNIFNLKYIHSEVSGQIFQKMIGIKLIESNIEWVVFLDDDVIVPKNMLDKFVSVYLKNDNFLNVCGFGFKIENLKFRTPNSKLIPFLKLAGLYSNKNGSVLTSGHVQEYQNSLVDIKTQWLNGASAWKVKVLANYNSSFPNIDYAAYEDVIFSYELSKKYELLFASEVVVVNQNSENYMPLTVQRFMAGAYMRYLFVSTNQELSRFRFLVAQIIRTIEFTIYGDKNVTVLLRFFKSAYIWFDLLLAILFKTNPTLLLIKRYN
jgi:glycosyltransferase involved in cell wall biosynthesis